MIHLIKIFSINLFSVSKLIYFPAESFCSYRMFHRAEQIISTENCAYTVMLKELSDDTKMGCKNFLVSLGLFRMRKKNRK
jgi:hypothetical protein